jgi:hypothetical protein
MRAPAGCSANRPRKRSYVCNAPVPIPGHRVERLIDRDTYLKTKTKLETQRHEVDTKINAASGQRFLINVPRAREEWKAAYENGNPSRANDRRRRADLLLRPHLAMAAATNVKKVPRWPAAFSFGERSAAAARRR